MGPVKRQKLAKGEDTRRKADEYDIDALTTAESDVTSGKTAVKPSNARSGRHANEKEEDDAEADEEDSQMNEGEDEPESSASALDTEDEIAGGNLRLDAQKKSQKRPRRRAVSPTRFGAALQSLLNTDAPSEQPLSLKPSIARKRQDEKLEGKARKVLEEETKVKKEKNHVSDLIGGWGGESERALRKVAQRGVVQLFNAIQQSHLAATAAQEELKTLKGSGKPVLPAPKLDHRHKKKGRELDKGLGASIGPDDFLNLIRSGGIVSKI